MESWFSASADDLIPFGTQFDGAGRRFWVGSNYWLVSLVGSRYQSTAFTWLEALKGAHEKIDTYITSVYILNSRSVGLKGTRMTTQNTLMTLEHTNKSNGVFCNNIFSANIEKRKWRNDIRYLENMLAFIITKGIMIMTEVVHIFLRPNNTKMDGKSFKKYFQVHLDWGDLWSLAGEKVYRLIPRDIGHWTLSQYSEQRAPGKKTLHSINIFWKSYIWKYIHWKGTQKHCFQIFLSLNEPLQ